MCHLATGDMLRKEVAIQSEIGNIAKSFMDSGKLVPDEVVIDIIKNTIIKENCQRGFILDGFPRTINQAIELDKMMNSLSLKILHATEGSVCHLFACFQRHIQVIILTESGLYV